jgi:hypothetical protein
LFYLRASDNLFYLSFGSLGFFAFLESFPYLLVVILIVLILLTGLIIKKSGIAYQKPFSYLALGLLAFILLAGIALSLTDVAERLQRSSMDFRPMDRMFRPLGGNGPYEGNRGVAGRITEVGSGYILIQTPRQILRLQLPVGLPSDFAVGEFVVAVGQKTPEGFTVQKMRQVDETEMPMIRDNVHRRFGPLDNESMETGRVRKSCLDNCFDLKMSPEGCNDKCLHVTSTMDQIVK